ncbi:hypothetical protein H9X57_15420 [Flavobacterium piscinae]|uniref:hypothetical protein n=1 Tax=Flavobacterium piscinae TaxID=2506424 RepID=UPI001982EE5F|nr:hypothetical protein [Flavobacterium piscinae]MBC8884262.1 hypothetical protein [Flavobacterium piscinae]
MKYSVLFFCFISQLLFAQTEEEMIRENQPVFKKAEQLLSQDNTTVEKSIQEIDQLIPSQSSVYVQHVLMIHKASMEKRINVKKRVLLYKK